MKRKNLNQLQLKKSKISKLLEIDYSAIKGGYEDSQDPRDCKDYDYSTNGCYTTWTT